MDDFDILYVLVASVPDVTMTWQHCRMKTYHFVPVAVPNFSDFPTENANKATVKKATKLVAKRRRRRWQKRKQEQRPRGTGMQHPCGRQQQGCHRSTGSGTLETQTCMSRKISKGSTRKLDKFSILFFLLSPMYQSGAAVNMCLQCCHAVTYV